MTQALSSGQWSKATPDDVQRNNPNPVISFRFRSEGNTNLHMEQRETMNESSKQIRRKNTLTLNISEDFMIEIQI